MSKHRLDETPVAAGADGKPIYGYRLEKAALEAFVAKAKELTQNQCLFATKPDGDDVLVVVIPVGSQPSPGFDDAMRQLDAFPGAQRRGSAASSMTFLEPGD